MFEDSESEAEPEVSAAAEVESEEDEPVLPVKKRGREPVVMQDQECKGKRHHHQPTRPSTMLEKISASYGDARLAAPRAAAPAGAGDAREVAEAPQHWTKACVCDYADCARPNHGRRTAEAARRRAVELRTNPSGLDGRAAYDRPSMHGAEIVISVGPSSLPASCRTTRSRIPSAKSTWR